MSSKKLDYVTNQGDFKIERNIFYAFPSYQAHVQQKCVEWHILNFTQLFFLATTPNNPFSCSIFSEVLGRCQNSVTNKLDLMFGLVPSANVVADKLFIIA